MEVTFSKAGSPVAGLVATRGKVPVAAPEEQVLIEQLEYLIAHAQRCTKGCSECTRFTVVREALMQVWR